MSQLTFESNICSFFWNVLYEQMTFKVKVKTIHIQWYFFSLSWYITEVNLSTLDWFIQLLLYRQASKQECTYQKMYHTTLNAKVKGIHIQVEFLACSDIYQVWIQYPWIDLFECWCVDRHHIRVCSSAKLLNDLGSHGQDHSYSIEVSSTCRPWKVPFYLWHSRIFAIGYFENDGLTQCVWHHH